MTVKKKVSSKTKTVLLGVTGSIAAYKAGDLVRRLQEKNFHVKVVMTKGAEEFITPLTLASLSGEKVHRGMFDKNEESWEMAHISLAKEADIVLIAPATANTIGKLAGGLADDILTCTALGTKAKVVIAPAMNTQMYNNKIVQENCSKLKRNGFIFIDPVAGQLACGDTGDGHLADADVIVKTIIRLLK